MERKVNKYLFLFLRPNVRLKCYMGAAMLCGVSVPNIGVWLPGSPPHRPRPAPHCSTATMNTGHSNVIHFYLFSQVEMCPSAD